MELRGESPNQTAILSDNTGKRELWAENDHFAGYVIEINGKGFEFCHDEA